MDKIRINLDELLLCFSDAMDLISPILSNHHQQVAYLSFFLAEQVKLPVEQQKDVFLAALVHDFGVLSKKERLELVETEPLTVNNHGFRGARLLERFRPLQNAARIVKFHHVPWNNGDGRFYMGEDVPFASHIVHLADRTCAMLRPDINVLTQLPDVLAAVREKSNTKFEPGLVDILFELKDKEYVWLDLMTSRSPVKKMPENGLSEILVLEIDDIVDLAFMFSQIIDFRSRFTACHSAGVAKTAEQLAQLVGFSPFECKMMLIAGYLHDLGKVTVDNRILEKPGKLSEEEFNEIRAHTYYTYHLLDAIPQFDTIKIWAAYHHEKLNGTGYPFHIKEDNLPLGSRVMAVADVFTAITEDRPYRRGMDDEQAIRVLNSMVAEGSLDGMVVEVLLDHFHEINTLRQHAQQEATERYDRFLQSEELLTNV
ncbi:MAG TPA: HD domain-containing protein [Syntrophomonadaceae bacterium]|nr:HD domain-containing protein [Syntrophomonadaceae bacterium]